MSTPAELAQDMTRVLDALTEARRYVAAHDEADAARSRATTPQYSALRTLLQHAEKAAERVHDYLNTPPETGPNTVFRDGGPL